MLQGHKKSQGLLIKSGKTAILKNSHGKEKLIDSGDLMPLKASRNSSGLCIFVEINLIGEEAYTCTISDISNSFGRRSFNFIRETQNFFLKKVITVVTISTNCLASSCAVKTSRALARKRDHNALQW